MIALEPPLRLARPDDGAVLAALMNAAGGGLPLKIWTGMAEGRDPWAVGAERCATRAARSPIPVIDEGEGVVAALIGQPISPAPERPGPDTPAMFVPLLELEAEAPSSWYVNALAALPGRRGEGLGSRLLVVADDMARAEGLAQVSLIVSDVNDRARALYRRRGFREVARRPKGPGWNGPGREWVLMIRDLEDAPAHPPEGPPA